MDGFRDRLQERPDALQINPFEAARRANLERGYVNDLLIGKKSTMRAGKMAALAEALECDPAYLRGQQAVPRAGEGAMVGLPLSGICEAGVWRDPGADLPNRPIPLSPDPRYPLDRQKLFLVRGDHAAGMGIPDGSVVIAISGVPTRDGDHVVVRRSRPSGEAETTVRRVLGGALSAGPIPTLRSDEAEIIGMIAVAFRLFG